jgi:hypothetical protein
MKTYFLLFRTLMKHDYYTYYKFHLCSEGHVKVVWQVCISSFSFLYSAIFIVLCFQALFGILFHKEYPCARSLMPQGLPFLKKISQICKDILIIFDHSAAISFKAKGMRIHFDSDHGYKQEEWSKDRPIEFYDLYLRKWKKLIHYYADAVSILSNELPLPLTTILYLLLIH